MPRIHSKRFNNVRFLLKLRNGEIPLSVKKKKSPRWMSLKDYFMTASKYKDYETALLIPETDAKILMKAFELLRGIILRKDYRARMEAVELFKKHPIWG